MLLCVPAHLVLPHCRSNQRTLEEEILHITIVIIAAGVDAQANADTETDTYVVVDIVQVVFDICLAADVDGDG